MFRFQKLLFPSCGTNGVLNGRKLAFRQQRKRNNDPPPRPAVLLVDLVNQLLELVVSHNVPYN